MAGRTLTEPPRFPGATRVLYYGYLTPAKLASLSVHQDRYDSVALRLDKIRLEHAEYRDIEEQGISYLVIREGTVIAKIQDLPAGLERLFLDSDSGKGTQLVELRLRPDDQILMSEGLFVTRGQSIARHDVSKQLRTLDLQLAADTERLQADFEQIELQLGVVDQELSSREAARTELETQLRALRSQALLSKEAERIGGKLREQETQVMDLIARQSMLLSRRLETTGRLQSTTREAAERRDIVAREAEVKAGFEGKILRIIHEAAGSEVTLHISYDTAPDFKWPSGPAQILP